MIRLRKMEQELSGRKEGGSKDRKKHMYYIATESTHGTVT